MSFKTGRFATTLFIVSLLIQMHIAASGYAGRRSGIAFSSTRDGNSEIYIMDTDGGNQVRLTNHPEEDSNPSWSPDGRRIAFVSNRDKGYDHIYVMDSDGRHSTKLTKVGANRTPAWSPDGKKIVYVRSKGGYQIWVMDADGGNKTRITHAGLNVYPAWSPDGNRIAFASFKGGLPEIYVMDANGNNQQQLTQHMAVTGHPSWSPDGQWIAYESQDEANRSQIYLVRSDGSDLPKRLTHNPPSKRLPAWSPDGGAIAYVTITPFPDQKGTIHLMTIDGIHLQQLREEHDGSDTEPDWYAPVGWSVSPTANFVTTWGEIKSPTSGR